MLPELDYPPVYAGAFAKALIEARLEGSTILKATKIFENLAKQTYHY